MKIYKKPIHDAWFAQIINVPRVNGLFLRRAKSMIGYFTYFWEINNNISKGGFM